METWLGEESANGWFSEISWTSSLVPISEKGRKKPSEKSDEAPNPVLSACQHLARSDRSATVVSDLRINRRSS